MQYIQILVLQFLLFNINNIHTTIQLYFYVILNEKRRIGKKEGKEERKKRKWNEKLKGVKQDKKKEKKGNILNFFLYKQVMSTLQSV